MTQEIKDVVTILDRIGTRGSSGDWWIVCGYQIKLDDRGFWSGQYMEGFAMLETLAVISVEAARLLAEPVGE